MAKKIIRHELVSITIPANTTSRRFNFPDIPNLRNSHIWGFQVYKLSEIPTDIQTQLKNGFDLTNLASCFITFVNYSGKEYLKQAPAYMFQSLVSLGLGDKGANIWEYDTKSFVGQKNNYPKSYIELTPDFVTLDVDTVFLCSVYYSLPLNEEEKESGYSFAKRV